MKNIAISLDGVNSAYDASVLFLSVRLFLREYPLYVYALGRRRSRLLRLLWSLNDGGLGGYFREFTSFCVQVDREYNRSLLTLQAVCRMRDALELRRSVLLFEEAGGCVHG